MIPISAVLRRINTTVLCDQANVAGHNKCWQYQFRPHLILFHTRSCAQNKQILVMISVNAMPDANSNCPVINHEITKVSMVPVTRQLTALAKLRTGVSFKTQAPSYLGRRDIGNRVVKGLLFDSITHISTVSNINNIRNNLNFILTLVHRI